MARIKKRPTVLIGGRIEATENIAWGGLTIPIGAQGTVYLHERPGRSAWRCVHWDGFERLQGNGYPYGMGGDASQDFVPSWAKRVEGGS
jgi:hypothetical protein